MDEAAPLRGILETVIYCAPDERDACEAFYAELLGLPVVARWDDGTSYRVGGGVLLLFDLEQLGQRDDPIAAHGALGPGHTCLLADGDDYERWKRRLAGGGIEIVHEHEWRDGMRSFYFRDPAQNLLEIASGDLWPQAA